MAAGATNAKVPWGAAGATGATGISFALSDLLVTMFKGIGWVMTESNVNSVEIIVAMLAAYVGSYLAGYMKDSGLTVKEQEADLAVAKKEAKKE